MIRGFGAEWTRITRTGYLLGFGGAIVALSVLLSTLFLVTLLSSPQIQVVAMREGSGFDDPFVAVAPLVMTLGIMTTSALVLGAVATASEYRHGTLRVSLVAHPQRWSYLAGRTAAVWALLGILVAIAAVLQVGVTHLVLTAKDVSTSAWWTSDGMATITGTIGRAILTTWAWALLGVLLATLLRSGAAAIGIGIGYGILVEPIVGTIYDDLQPFLFGSALDAFVGGGTPSMTLAGAAGLVAAYAALFAVFALLVFERRDVST